VEDEPDGVTAPPKRVNRYEVASVNGSAGGSAIPASVEQRRRSIPSEPPLVVVVGHPTDVRRAAEVLMRSSVDVAPYHVVASIVEVVRSHELHREKVVSGSGMRCFGLVVGATVVVCMWSVAVVVMSSERRPER